VFCQNTHGACASIRRACQSPLRALSLRLLLRQLPSLTTLSLRGRLLTCREHEDGGVSDDQECASLEMPIQFYNRRYLKVQ
jgi:hypothetical protein